MKEIISDRASLLQKELSLSSKSPVRSRTKAMNHTLKRARGLWKITSLLSNATSIEEVAKIVIDEGFRVMGAHNGDLALLSHDGSLHLIAYKGYPKNFQKKWPTFSNDTPLLTTEVIRSQTPMFIKNIDEIDKKYKIAKLFIQSSGSQSACLIPLVNKKKIIGILQFTFKEPQQFSSEDRLFITTLANQCALSFLRVFSQEQLRSSKDQLEAILKNSANGIIAQTMTGEIVFINDTAAMLFGYKKAQHLKNKHYTVLSRHVMISDENDREISPLTSSQMVKKIYATKKEQVLQITTRKSRETAWVSVKRSVITSKADDEKLFLEVYNNITPSKELDSRKDEFISLASHELRTPLTSMRLFLDLLGKHVQTIDDKKIALFTQKARDQATRLNKLVTELFDISRIQKGKLSINTEKTRLDEILESTVSDLQMITPTHKIELSSCPKALVIADKYRIYQVLINLINNAVKHSSDGQRIIVSLKKSRHYAQIGVRDFGVGIPHDKQELIFERFYQIRNNSGKQVSGLGIGLFIANEIVRSHHGKMWVKSKVGQGSTFFFTLPLLETSVSPQKIGQ